MAIGAFADRASIGGNEVNNSAANEVRDFNKEDNECS
jgi:hypothetical protein